MSNYRKFAEHSLNVEINALNSVLKKSINDIFDRVIDMILNTKGRVILSAVGKPGYIAHKIAASLASTGTQSFYIHPDEASHGDLGMVSEDDTIIVLSASGESKELKDIMNYAKRFGLNLIGVTLKADSNVAKMADVPVVLDDIEETNILKSPTTSTLMFLAYFDAVVTTLINVRKFDIEQYKKFHPGGKLGIGMLKIGELMVKNNDAPICFEDDPMTSVINTMINRNYGCIIVLNKNENLVGIISDGDFKRKLLVNNDFLEKKAKDIMAINPIIAKDDAFAIDVVRVMNGDNEKKRYIQSIIVVDSKNTSKVVGLLHIKNLLEAGVI
jgi:arabinose-5-phosphate isomerase